jgi:hypothetical protein
MINTSQHNLRRADESPGAVTYEQNPQASGISLGSRDRTRTYNLPVNGRSVIAVAWPRPRSDRRIPLARFAYVFRLCMQSRLLLEHTWRFAKTALGWARAALRLPEQFARWTWTWIIISAITKLRLARVLAEDRLPRERRRRSGRLTPGRVRRDFARPAAIADTSASPPKPLKPGPAAPKAATAPQHRVTT